MKSILLVSDKFPPHIGGMETHAYEFLKYFQGRRADYRLQALSFLAEETPDSIAIAPQKDLPVCEGVEHILPYDSIFDAKLPRLIKEVGEATLLAGSPLFLQMPHLPFSISGEEDGNFLPLIMVLEHGATCPDLRIIAVCADETQFLHKEVVSGVY